MPHFYETDGAEIYRASFATIRAEADLAGLDPALEPVVVRMIHAAGMVGLERQVRASPGFAEAARVLGLARSVVTRQIGELEDKLGVQLLIRTTRKVSLTQAGEIYFQRLRPLVDELEQVVAEAAPPHVGLDTAQQDHVTVAAGR